MKRRQMEVNKSEYNSALEAIYNNKLSDFKKHVDKLDDINYVDDQNRSLIFYTVLENHIELLNYLIKKKINLNLKDKNGWTPLHYSVSESLSDISNVLIDSGSNVNEKDNYGNNVIWRAVFSSKGKGDIISLLRKNNANPKIKNNSGISALDLSDTIDNYDIKQFFK